MRPGVRLRQRAFAVLLGAVGVVMAGCARDAPQDYLQPIGETARKVDELWNIVFLIAAIIFFIVEGLLVYALFRFRHREGREAAQFHGNTRVEIILTVVPALILAGLAVPTVRTLFDVASEPSGALQIKVIGHQFWWEYQYDLDNDGETDFFAANELHIPTGQPVRLTLEGDVINNDVIHSFWIPKLAGKQDVVPGRQAEITLQTNTPGTYMGQCTEFCGLSHANMRTIAIAHQPQFFEAWAADQQRLAAEPTDAAALAGQTLFLEGQCANCHTVAGTDAQGRVGPDLTHFASRSTFGGATFENNAANLAAWLANPPGLKPGSRMPDLGLTQDEIQKLIAYLQTLK